MSQFGWRGDYWSKKKARMISALSFFVPGIPLFFMGDEFAMEGSFNDARKEYILNWRLEKITPGGDFKAMFRRLIDLRQTYDPLIQDNTTFEWLHYPSDGWFAFKRKWNAAVLLVAGNWSGFDMLSYSIPTGGESGTWTQIFNSDGQEFGGDGIGNFNNNPSSNGGSIVINIPKNGIVVMGEQQFKVGGTLSLDSQFSTPNPQPPALAREAFSRLISVGLMPALTSSSDMTCAEEIQCESCGARASVEKSEFTTRCLFCDAPSVISRGAGHRGLTRSSRSVFQWNGRWRHERSGSGLNGRRWRRSDCRKLLRSGSQGFICRPVCIRRRWNRTIKPRSRRITKSLR